MKYLENVMIKEMENIKIERCDSCRNTMLQVECIELVPYKFFYEKENEGHHIEIFDDNEEYIKQDKIVIIRKVRCKKCGYIIYENW